jgi:hypothetical protein
MKKKVLPLAVGAASAVAMSAAHAAMYVNERGTGETLIFPFYSAENGNNTLVNIANTTTDTKAVKVRILEAQNSQEVLDFNLYLSPEDHFSFAIAATEGGAKLVTGDKSCTVPAIPADGVAFRNIKYAGDKLAIEDDPKTDADESKGNFDNTGIGRTQVGYIEVIEMGQIDPKSAVIIDKTPKSATYTPINAAAAIKHGADGVPADCQILVDAWSTIKGVDGVWLGESKTTDLTGDSEFMAAWQGGGLYGYATVINVPQGAAFGYDAVAVADHVAAGATGSDMHYQPGDIRPNFGDSAMNTSAIINVNGQAVTLDFNGDYPDEAVERVQALNATMMSTEVYNDYVTDPAIAATTDWLFTFPTKAFHVNEKVVAVEPFSALWTGKAACEPSELSALDREESTPPPPPAPGSSGPDFSPAPPTPPGTPPAGDDVPLCYEATIMQFAGESAAGTSTVAVGVNAYLDANDGWATVSFDVADLDTTLAACVEAKGATVAPKLECDRMIDAGDGQLFGLPVTGFAVQKYVNGSAGGAGVLANYAMATNHKSCAAGSGTANNDC